jgi:tetratricopeptide (TPR) repeat protein
VSRHHPNTNQQTSKIPLGSQLASRGFGGASSASARAGANASAQSAQSKSSQRQLYDTQISPLLEGGFEQKAEPLLRLLAQGTNPLPEVFRDLGVILEARGQSLDAEGWYRRWLNRLPKDASQRLAQAIKAEQLDMIELALERYLNVLELQEQHPEALRRASELLMACGRFVEAMPLLSIRLDTEAHSVELLQLASRCAIELGELTIAAGWAEQALALQSDLSVTKAIQARFLQQHRYESDALMAVEQALQLAQDTPDWTLVNRLLAPILLQQGQLERCEHMLDVALAAEPSRSELHQQRAELMLLQNRLHEGFQEHLWRHCSDQEATVTAPCPPLQLLTVTPSASRPLALACEGTLGDTLLFSRYAHWLKHSRGVDVCLYVQLPLLRLLSHSLGETIPVKPQYQLRHLPAEAHVLPLPSLPAVYGTCQEHPELASPHLHADPTLVSQWRQRLSLKPSERLLGLNWHGSPLQALEEHNPSDIPLEVLQPLAALPHVQLLSLQKGVGSEQLDICSFRSTFVAQQQEVNAEVRLEHIAALMALCDWIVTDDSGPAHLAGCLGVPTLVLLPSRCNWRWGANGSQHPWYPNTTLLRQQSGFGWEPLVQQACALIGEDLARTRSGAA